LLEIVKDFLIASAIVVPVVFGPPACIVLTGPDVGNTPSKEIADPSSSVRSLPFVPLSPMR
jgi:hypothetical protein